MNIHRDRVLVGAAALFLFGGCVSSQVDPPTRPQPPSSLQAAEALFGQARYTEAIEACIDIARRDPLAPGLADLQARITAKMAELRTQTHARRNDASDAAAIVDGRRHDLLPDTYRLTRNVLGDSSPLRTPLNRMQEILKKPVSVHLENVGLTEIIAQIGASQNINIVADGSVGAGTITVHAEKTPLIEILDYVGRNLNVAFSAGDNIIWVTKSAATDSGIPLETRIYRLRKGLSGGEITPGAAAGGGTMGGRSGGGRSGGGRGGGGGGGGGGGATAVSDIIEAAQRFVPQPTGADILFNPKAHALLVKNTRENLLLTEDLIAALDVRPVQVLIEARFMDVAVSDLRELGIDWILNKDLPLSSGNRIVGTTSPNNPVTAILTDNGDPTRASQGLNLTYQGVLGNAEFQAVLHALQESGKAKTLTVPRVTTLNNKTATIRIGEDFRFFENFTLQQTTRFQGSGNTTTTYTDSQLVPSGTPSLEELGYELVVTPSVGADLATIDLKLSPQISDVKPESEWIKYDLVANNSSNGSGGSSSTNSNGTVKLPIFTRSMIETEAVVHSGETVVLGGLAKTKRSVTTTGVPILSSLPLIGYLFRSESKQDDVDNMIIFVTATILADSGEELIPLNASEPVDAGRAAAAKK
jgi:type II secretory pathway component GspD/PulD (secretin)